LKIFCPVSQLFLLSDWLGVPEGVTVGEKDVQSAINEANASRFRVRVEDL
jgi:hypothetical protein